MFSFLLNEYLFIGPCYLPVARLFFYSFFRTPTDSMKMSYFPIFLTNSCEKKRSEKQRRKGKIYQFDCRAQRIARRDKKVFLSDQCKEIKENNRM